MPELHADDVPADSCWASDPYIAKVLNLVVAFICLLQRFQMESDPLKLLRCRGYKNRIDTLKNLQRFASFELLVNLFLHACYSLCFLVIVKLIV